MPEFDAGTYTPSGGHPSGGPKVFARKGEGAMEEDPALTQQVYADYETPPRDPTQAAISYNTVTGATLNWNIFNQAWE